MNGVWKKLAERLRLDRNTLKWMVAQLQKRNDELREKNDLLGSVIADAGLEPVVDFVEGLANDPVTGNPRVTELAASSLARMFWPLLDLTRAANFVEMSVGHGDRQLLVTVVRLDGKRPSEMMKEAQRERDAAIEDRKRIDADYRTALDTIQRMQRERKAERGGGGLAAPDSTFVTLSCCGGRIDVSNLAVETIPERIEKHSRTCPGPPGGS